MKNYKVIGIGNALVDIILDVSDAELAATGFERGTQRLVTPEEQRDLLGRFETRKPALVSGGSVANSMIGIAQLGGKAAFITSIADDRYGLFYTGECESLALDLVNPPAVGGMTGSVVVLVTPDSERTMRTCLASASDLGAQHVTPESVSAAEWLFVEGYLFANPEKGQGAIKKAIQIAKSSGTKIAITCSESWVVTTFADPVREALATADLVFANEAEAKSLTGSTTLEDAFRLLCSMVPNVVITAGPQGAWVKWHGNSFHVDAFACQPRDLTGAGDMFAGAFLYGISHGVDPEVSARAACYLAMQVITRVGARLHTGTKDFWQACVEGQV